jgi:ankyrin repeat protein
MRAVRAASGVEPSKGEEAPKKSAALYDAIGNWNPTERARLVQNALMDGADPNSPPGKVNGSPKSSPLFAALWLGDSEVVKLLLDKGADLRQVNTSTDRTNGNTPLIAAADAGMSDIVKIILAAKAVNVNAQNEEGFTALIASAMRGSTPGSAEVFYTLLATEGVDVNVKTKQGITALNMAITNSKLGDAAIALLDKGADPNATPPTYPPPLIEAIGAKKTNLVIALLNKGADPNAKDEKGRTALDAAGYNCEIVDALLAKGAKQSFESTKGAGRRKTRKTRARRRRTMRR